MAAAGDEAPVRILHLSDFHFCTTKKWDADLVLRPLADAIERDVADGLKPDLVAITGDLAHAGTAEEYALARDWLETRLWKALGDPPRDHLLLVPGNHDVDRKSVGRAARLSQNDLLNSPSQDGIAAVLQDDGEREILLQRHNAYLNFLSSWLGETHALPWWQRGIKIRGTKLHLSGLDSAWMACGDEDRGRLLLGRYQLSQTVMCEEAEKAGWRIALLHHPWDYLAEFDHHETRAAVHLHCDLLLRGHLHFPLSERIVPPDQRRSCLELAAGCAYENGQYPNAFQWIELFPDKRVRTHFRAWLHGAWAVDRNQPGCPDGHTEFPLSAPTTPARPRARSRSPMQPTALAIPPDYLAWLQRTYSDVSLLGQDTQKGLALTLSHVYVPAVTRPAVEPLAAMKNQLKTREDIGEQKPVMLLQRLDMDSLYVPAPAGAGKSTFCRWATLQSIAGNAMIHPVAAPEDFTEPVPMSLRGRLPLLVPLRDFWQRMGCSHEQQTWYRADLERALAAWIDASPPEGLTGGLLTAHLEAGTAFLLLDGLDEVPVSQRRDGGNDSYAYPRACLLSSLADALPAWRKAGNRVLLTSRPYGLDEAGLHRLGLERAPLEPLPRELQELFITRWFHTLGRTELTAGLIETIRGRYELAPLVENPMLLTALCVLYDSGGRLPEDRYELYKRIVNNVLFNRFPGDSRQREPVKARLEAIALGMHTGDKDAPRASPAAEVSHLEIERLLGAFAPEDLSYEQRRVEPAVRREELLTRSGLLLPRPNDRAAFYHLSFQEYLAAERILRTHDDLEPIFRERSAVAEWHLTLMFLMAGKVAGKTPQWGADLLTRLIEGQDRHAVRDNPAPAVFIAEALELCLAKKYAVPDALAERFRRLALDAIEDEVELKSRQVVGLCLGRVGDPRIFDLRDPRAYVEVPAGRYPSGEEAKTVQIAMPFLIGRYPVTNGQYQAFVDDGGYRDRRWCSDGGWKWLQEEKVTEPRFWHDRRWNVPNQPVVGLTFWEAEACSAWAGGRLPSEQEWEAAARGPNGFEYPWGNEWENGICNTDEAGLGVTSPVGLFPRSRQADLGMEDLAGNVWEWCGSLYKPSDTDPNAPRVLRGGSWFIDRDYARSASRVRLDPCLRNSNIGFRVVCSSPIKEH